MNRLLFFVVAFTAILSAVIADARFVPKFSSKIITIQMGYSFYYRSYDDGSENKVERRGFKSSLLSTARGFGKRSSPASRIQDERYSCF